MTELFRHVSKSVISVTSDYMNVFDTFICNKDQNLSIVALWSHEHGHTRVFVNIQDMVRSRHASVRVRTVHTDVVATELADFQIVSGLQELWL